MMQNCLCECAWRRILAAALACSATFGWMVSGAEGPQRKPGPAGTTRFNAATPDLLEQARFQGLGPPLSDDQKMFLFRFTRAGLRLETVLLTPGAVFELEIPASKRASCVSFRAAMPFNLGDGAMLEIIGVQRGVEQKVVERRLDPAHVRADREWVPIDFELRESAEPTHLRIRINPGEAGDHSGDWVGVAPGLRRGCLFSISNNANGLNN